MRELNLITLDTIIDKASVAERVTPSVVHLRVSLTTSLSLLFIRECRQCRYLSLIQQKTPASRWCQIGIRRIMSGNTHEYQLVILEPHRDLKLLLPFGAL